MTASWRVMLAVLAMSALAGCSLLPDSPLVLEDPSSSGEPPADADATDGEPGRSSNGSSSEDDDRPGDRDDGGSGGGDASTVPTAPEVEPAISLSDAETYPNAKNLAVEVARTLTTYDVDDEPVEVTERLVGESLAGALAEDAAPLLRLDAWSRGEVVYPQLGGIEPGEAVSVMVVIRQRLGLPEDREMVQTRTLDVRLELIDGAWAFDELASAGGEVVPRPDDLPNEAVAVLDDERIELPDTARWDIHRGAIETEVLEVMAELADRAPYGVVVLETGHPYNIFGTDRISKHSLGRAVDVHRIGEQLVIDDRAEGSATYATVEWLYEQPEVSETGSPWALDGYGGRSFTDDLHQDHLHVGVGDDPRPERATDDDPESDDA